MASTFSAGSSIISVILGLFTRASRKRRCRFAMPIGKPMCLDLAASGPCRTKGPEHSRDSPYVTPPRAGANDAGIVDRRAPSLRQRGTSPVKPEAEVTSPALSDNEKDLGDVTCPAPRRPIRAPLQLEVARCRRETPATPVMVASPERSFWQSRGHQLTRRLPTLCSPHVPEGHPGATTASSSIVPKLPRCCPTTVDKLPRQSRFGPN